MSLSMLRRAALDLRWTVLWFSVGIAAYVVIVTQFWPTAKNNAALLTQYIEQFPPAFMEAFGISDMSHVEGFLGAEILNFMWPLVAAIFVIGAASATVGGEIDRGTVELWLSVPEARWRLLSAKLVAVLLGILVLAAATGGALVGGARLVGESLLPAGIVAAGVVLSAFCVAVAGYSALFSAVLGTRGRAAGLAAAVTLASYLAGVIAGLSRELEWLRYVAITAAFHPQQALASGAVPGLEVAALWAVGLAGAALSLVAFERRDVAP